MPGKVIRGHQEWERECRTCHKRFDRQAQSALCLACHDDIEADIHDGRFHGYVVQQPCSQCHTDHDGPDAQVVTLDSAAFDHDKTRYKLREGHAHVKCAKCHADISMGAISFAARIRPECSTCHREDDVHRGDLSNDCASCHDEADWRRATGFDHEKTGFPLRTGKHLEAECHACHRVENQFSTAYRKCVDCHENDIGLSPEHRKRYGDSCGNCHSDRDWREIHFRHDADTEYPLRGRHRQVSCDSCHLLEEELRSRNGWSSTDCPGCEESWKIAQQHFNGLKERCTACHQDGTCRSIRAGEYRADADRREKPGRRCESCHLPDRRARRPKPGIDSSCVTCHEREDMEKGHRGGLGENCEACHDETNWSPWTGRDSYSPMPARWPLPQQGEP